MPVELVTAPTEWQLTFAAALEHLRLPDSSDQAYVEALIKAATSLLEGKTWSKFETQTWKYYLDEFPASADTAIEMPYPPLRSLSVQYYDTAGALQTWAASKYTVDIVSRPGRVYPAYTEVYPSTYGIPKAVIITFVCGYMTLTEMGSPPVAVADFDFPAELLHALKLTVSHLYENREPLNEGGPMAELPFSVSALIADCRFKSF